MSSYDAAAPSFDQHRALPDGVAPAIRAAVLAAIGEVRQPRLLDLGAGTGRIGWPFVAAGDDYVGVDLSLGMLRAFVARAECNDLPARLAQADGKRLPFPDGTFDAVLLIQVFGGMRSWRPFVTEARRVLRRTGTLVVGRTVAPADGIDAQMKQHLAHLLDAMGVGREQRNVRDEVRHWLGTATSRITSVIAASWNSQRTPKEFLVRHRTGAQFAALPDPVKDEAMRQLGLWAAETFGSLDPVFSEQHVFELHSFKFAEEMGC
jgi:ubiquinone/menaquinone biosynthesis C-methylase UbiE